MTDWTRFRKCPVCHAAIGAQCVNLSGLWVDGQLLAALDVPADRPHTSRKLRTVSS